MFYNNTTRTQAVNRPTPGDDVDASLADAVVIISVVVDCIRDDVVAAAAVAALYVNQA